MYFSIGGGELEALGIIKQNLFAHGNYAVDFFFAVSAYFLCSKVESRKPLTFFWERLKRLYPAYWLAVLLVSASFVFWGKAITLKQVFVNLTMLQRLVGISDIDGAHWTMVYEWILLSILTIYIVLKKFRPFKCPFWSVMIWLASCLLLRFCLTVLGKQGMAVEALALGSGYVQMFVLGIAARPFKMSHRGWIVLFSCAIYELLIQGGLTEIACWRLFVMAATWVILVWGIPQMRDNIFSALGHISYEMYLIHNGIGKLVLSTMLSNNSNTLQICLCVILLLFAMLFVAYFIHIIVNCIHKRLILK